MRRFGSWLVLAALLPSLALAQAPRQTTGPITIIGEGSNGPASGFMRAVPGGVNRSLSAAAADIINVKDLAANVCTGSDTIDTAALTAALTKAAAAPGSTIRLPACTYKLRVSNTNGFVIPSGTTIAGDGARTIVTWNDSEASDANPLNLFGVGDLNSRRSDITFRDFAVRGSGATLGFTPAYPFLLYNVDGLTFRNVTSEYSRIMGIVARASTAVTADGNIVRYTRSDGINLSECSKVSVRNNDIYHINDDAIGLHSDNKDAEIVRDTLVVTGNRIFDSQGIRVLSGRKASIAGNTLTNVRQFGISLETLPAYGGVFQEGSTPAEGVSITGNVITNVIDRAAVDNFNQNANAIVITGTSARKGGLASVPGDGGGGLIPDPYKELLANSPLTSVATPGSGAIIVANNVIARTLPASNGTDARFTKWSDFKQGPMWTHLGNIDPSLPESAMQATGVVLRDGVIRDVLITNNIFRGLGRALDLQAGQRFDNIVFRGNQVIDANFGGVVVNTTARMRLYVDDNIFDMDPYSKAPLRAGSGTWASAGAPYAILQQSGAGVYVRRNVFRNTNTLFNQGLAYPGFFFAENIAEADITTFGAFSAANKGIGSVPASTAQMRYARVGSDPSDPAYGAMFTSPTYP